MSNATQTDPETTTTTKKNKRTRAKRKAFPVENALDANGQSIALDDKNRLTAVPMNWTKDYRRFSRSNFASTDLFFEWLESLEAAKIARIQERIEEIREEATEAREGPDPTKKAIRKLQRMAKVAEALKAQLQAEGVDLSELGI